MGNWFENQQKNLASNHGNRPENQDWPLQWSWSACSLRKNTRTGQASNGPEFCFPTKQQFSSLPRGREPWGDHQEFCTMKDSHSKPWNTSRVWWFGERFQPKERPAFLDPGTTMNGKKYLELVKEKLELHMAVHNCEIFMHDGAPCHQAKIVTDFLKTKDIKLLEWPGNSPDLNPNENFWTELKNRAAEKHPISLPSLIKTIKSSWVLDMPTELCRNLIESMSRRIRAVLEAKGGHTKYWMLIFLM